MPPTDREAELRDRFLELLADTLDVDKTIKELAISRDRAAAILRSVAPRRAEPRQGRPLPERPRVREGVGPGRYDIHVDGASRGNPGRAGAGAVITDHSGAVVEEIRRYVGVATNNVAEYSALVMALEEAAAMGIRDVRVYADSELMVRQMNGIYRVKSPDLAPYYEKAAALGRSFRSFTIAHVPREDNSRADRLANEAIDAAGR